MGRSIPASAADKTADAGIDRKSDRSAIDRTLIGSWLDGWRVGWMDGELVGWMESWLDGWRVGWETFHVFHSIFPN